VALSVLDIAPDGFANTREPFLIESWSDVFGVHFIFPLVDAVTSLRRFVTRLFVTTSRAITGVPIT
jgi:hypothetical protein